MQRTIQAGRYRHCKGNFYEVLGVARPSETEEQMVVYRCLSDGNSLWARPLAMFLETVEAAGRACHGLPKSSRAPELLPCRDCRTTAHEVK